MRLWCGKKGKWMKGKSIGFKALGIKKSEVSEIWETLKYSLSFQVTVWNWQKTCLYETGTESQRRPSWGTKQEWWRLRITKVTEIFYFITFTFNNWYLNVELKYSWNVKCFNWSWRMVKNRTVDMYAGQTWEALLKCKGK
jgi:hypothetical protein